MEQECKWNFKEEGGRDVGPNDPVHEKFKQEPYSSIVRESIQNSLDAIKDETKPVKIDFTFFTLDKGDYPNLFDIKTHIDQCTQYYSDNENATDLFRDMMEFLDSESTKMNCLKISDYNTKGMNYEPTNRNSPFYAFLRAGGVSAKNQGSGGSFGFGKGAYYALSPIKTIIVSSKDEYNNVFFEGSTILTTHIDNSGKTLTAYGYYDSNNGEPTQNEQDIPSIFRREHTGTDVNIIGLWKNSNRDRFMIMSVLENFWYAIFDNKLVVTVNDIVINKNNLERIVAEYFDDTKSNADNPMPYIRAVKYAEKYEEYKSFEEDLATLGKVKLFVYLDKELPNDVSYFRKPKMLVFKKSSNKISGFAAVFICDNDGGNNILRRMENPAHTEWKKENFRVKGDIDEKARKAEKEIREFVNKSLDSLSKIKKGKKMIFLNLDEYLSIPEDLIDKGESFENEGKNDSHFGSRSHEISSLETGSQTTLNTLPPSPKPIIKIQSRVKEKKNIEKEEGGTEKILFGGNNNSAGGNSQSQEKETLDKDGIENEENSKKKVFVDVTLKVAAQREGEELFHYLLITSNKSINLAEIELYVSGDNGINEGIQLKYSNKGVISNNIIKNIQLDNGKNEIKVSFGDNIKYSIKIKTYEI